MDSNGEALHVCTDAECCTDPVYSGISRSHRQNCNAKSFKRKIVDSLKCIDAERKREKRRKQAEQVLQATQRRSYRLRSRV